MMLPLTYSQMLYSDMLAAIKAGTLPYNLLKTTNINIQFQLDVAASTTATSNGANNAYWGEARGNWSFNGSGSVAYNSKTGTFTWTPNPTTPTSTGAGVFPSTAWTSLTLTSEPISEEIFNTLRSEVTFASPS
jgi:hypothetical protein